MSWWIFCLTFFLTAGFAKLLTAVLNRLQSIPQPKWLLVIFVILHFLMMPCYAGLLVASLLNEGLWLSDRPGLGLTSFEAILIFPGVMGFVLLVLSTVNFQRYRPPKREISNESRLVDFRQSVAGKTWQQRLIGQGKMRRLAFLPGNEQFTLEVSTKTYLLPRLPKEWDGLSIVHLADTHFLGAVSKDYFEAVCEQAIALKPDLFVFTGDLLDNLTLLDWVPDTFGRLQAPFGQYFILGNHDWYLDASRIRAAFEQQGWIDLSSRYIELASPKSGPPIVLAGDETPWMGTHPDLSQTASESFRILLSHTPDNFPWAQNEGIDLMLAGHTHGGQIRLPLLGPIYSPSRFGCQFASGVFWREPTLMSVSRGISGREPIRIRCVPELTKLVLKTGHFSARNQD
jgi:predicted MPP superfamily phosphohydrolase